MLAFCASPCTQPPTLAAAVLLSSHLMPSAEPPDAVDGAEVYRLVAKALFATCCGSIHRENASPGA